MTVALSPAFGPGYQGFTVGGLPLSGGLLYTFLAGTNTPAATYTTSSGSIANTNPIVLGPDGRPPFEIWLTTGQAYLFTLKDALNNQIGTYDNITATDPAGSSIFATLGLSTGTTLIGWLRNAAGSVLTTVYNFLNWTEVSVAEFMTSAQVTDAISGSPAIDSSVALAAAVASRSTRGGTVRVPANFTLSIATGPTMFNGVVVRGESENSSRIKYTGTGILFDMTGISEGGLEKMELLTDAGGTTQAIRIAAGNLNTIENIKLAEWTPNSGTGWNIGITVEPNAALTTNSTSNVLNNIYLNAVRSVGLRITRSIDTFLSEVRSFGILNGITFQHIVLETGASGVYMSQVSLGYGLHGVSVQNTISPGAAPIFIFADQVLCDTMTGGDGWNFDTTLNNSVTSFVGTNLWAAGCGKTNTGTNTTVTANGVGIYGGRGIEWHGRMRANANNGCLINSTNVYEVCIKGWASSNNQANNTDGHGVYAQACGEGFSCIGLRAGNTALDAGGFQKYGVKMSSSVGADWNVTGCRLKDNVTGPILIQTTLNGTSVGNTPADATQDANIGMSRLLLGNGWVCTKKALALANAGTLVPDFMFSGAIVTVRNGTNAGFAVFAIDSLGTGSTKISGPANIVLGAPGASQLGISATTGTVTQGWAAAQDVYANYYAVQ